MHHREFLLSALKYPKASTASLQNDTDFAALVIWLENTKVGPDRAVGPTVKDLHASGISLHNNSSVLTHYGRRYVSTA